MLPGPGHRALYRNWDPHVEDTNEKDKSGRERFDLIRTPRANGAQYYPEVCKINATTSKMPPPSLLGHPVVTVRKSGKLLVHNSSLIHGADLPAKEQIDARGGKISRNQIGFLNLSIAVPGDMMIKIGSILFANPE